MAEYPKRNALRADFARTLARLGTRHRRELLELMGDPPNPDRVPDEFWERVKREIDAELLATLLVLVIMSSTMHGMDEEAADLAGELWATDRASQSAAQIVASSQARLAAAARAQDQTLGVAAFQGAGGAGVATAEATAVERVRDVASSIFGPERWAGVARNESNVAMNEGGKIAIKHTGVDVTCWWRHTEQADPGHAGADDDPCPICTPWLDTEEEFWPEDLEPGYAHINCILPGNLVSPLGKIAAATKAFYKGVCVEITLESGRRFTCTKNHPVLTPSGWKSAGLLQVGDDVVGAVPRQAKATPISPDANHVPAPIEQVFASLRMARGMNSSSMPCAAEDFHGDGDLVKGDVEIIWADGHLSPGRESAFLKERYEHGFIRRSRHISRLARGGHFHALRDGSLASPHGGMGSAGLSAALGSRHATRANKASLTAIPQLYSPSDQVLPERSTSDSEFDRKPIVGLAGQVSPNDRFRDDVENPRRSGNPRAPHAVLERALFDAQISGDLVHVLTGFVATDHVVEIRNFNFSGHVYDLHVEKTHAYECGGIIVHNCDCFREWVEVHSSRKIGSPDDDLSAPGAVAAAKNSRRLIPVLKSLVADLRKQNDNHDELGRFASGSSGGNPQTKTPEFRAWFGASKVVDDKGEPLVVYHGTRTRVDFNSFAPDSHFGALTAANTVANNGGPYGPARIFPAYLSIQNPKRIEDQATHGWGDWGDAVAQAKSEGHDGIVYANAAEGFGTDSWVAFHPTQIKSATGNSGRFDPRNPDITKSLTKDALGLSTSGIVPGPNPDIAPGHKILRPDENAPDSQQDDKHMVPCERCGGRHAPGSPHVVSNSSVVCPPVTKFNPNHEPAGTPEGGQFAEGDSGGGSSVPAAGGQRYWKPDAPLASDAPAKLPAPQGPHKTPLEHATHLLGQLGTVISRIVNFPDTAARAFEYLGQQVIGLRREHDPFNLTPEQRRPGGKSLAKMNDNHDELGRFASGDSGEAAGQTVLPGMQEEHGASLEALRARMEADKPKITERIQRMLDTAKQVPFTDERVDRGTGGDVGRHDYDEIEAAMSDSEKDDMESSLDETKQEYIDSALEDYGYSDNTDLSEAEREAGWQNGDVETKATEAIGGLDGLSDEAKTKATEEVANWFQGSSGSGTDGIDSLVEHLEEHEVEQDAIDAVSALRDTAEYEIQDALSSQEDSLRENAREDAERDYNDSEARRDYLSNFFDDQDTDRFSPGPDEDKLKKWGFDSSGDHAFMFPTAFGETYEVWAKPWTAYGMGTMHIGFQDSSGSYGITGKAGPAGAAEVFRNVTTAVTSFVLHEKPETVMFSAAEKSRSKLYDHLVRTTAAALPDYKAVVGREGDHSTYGLIRRDTEDKFAASLQRYGNHVEIETLVKSKRDPRPLKAGSRWEYLDATVDLRWFSHLGWSDKGVAVTKALVDHDLRASIAEASAATDTDPTEAQAQAGNYAKGKVWWNGFEIAIENPKGSVRSGVSASGKPWEVKLAHAYGYLRRTLSGSDGDQLDCFLGPDPESELIFVVDQRKPDGSHDEHKVMLGFTSKAEARQGYLDCFSPGWDGLAAITPMTLPEFKVWVEGWTAWPVAKENRAKAVSKAIGLGTKKSDSSGDAESDDGHWVTIDGTHVKISGEGEVLEGPAALEGKQVSDLGGEHHPESEAGKQAAEEKPAEKPAASKPASKLDHVEIMDYEARKYREHHPADDKGYRKLQQEADRVRRQIWSKMTTDERTAANKSSETSEALLRHAQKDGPHDWVNAWENPHQGEAAFKTDATASATDLVSMEKKVFDASSKSLDVAQLRSLQLYTSGNFEGINGGLRGGSLDPGYKNAVAKIDSAFAKSGLSQSVTVYRGAQDITFLGDPSKLVGKTISEKGYTSTSLSPAVADGFAMTNGDKTRNARFEITLPKGSKALNPDTAFGGMSMAQHEVVLPHDSRFKITGVEKRPLKTEKGVSSFYVIKAELVK